MPPLFLPSLDWLQNQWHHWFHPPVAPTLLQQEPAALPIELSSHLTALSWEQLPKGDICNWTGTSLSSRSRALLPLVAQMNQDDHRCVLIDVPAHLAGGRWKLLSASGRNWLVRPERRETAIPTARMLLLSRQFDLVVIVGIDAHDVHPTDLERLRMALAATATLLFLPNYSLDHSGEPLKTRQAS